MFHYLRFFYERCKRICDPEVHEDIWDKLGPL